MKFFSYLYGLERKRGPIASYFANLEKPHQIHIRANIQQHKCFIGIQDGKIVSAALLQAPKGKRVSVGDYTKAGAVSLVFPVGFAKILDFFDISEKPIRIVRWST